MNKLVLTVFFLLALTTGCSQAVREDRDSREVQPQVEMGERFSGSGYSAAFPKDWRIEEFEDGSVVAHDNILDSFRENVVITAEELQEKATLADYYAKSRTGLSDLPEYIEVETGGAAIAGMEAKWVLYTQKGLQGPLKAKAWFLVKEGLAYRITCTAESSQFDNYGKTFEAIAKNFMVEK